MAAVFLGLGSNLGDRAGQLRTALARLESTRWLRLRRLSSFRETEPVGGPEQPRFVNAVAEFECSRGPHALLSRLQRLEREQGRRRTVANGPRTLDLDLLLYGNYRGRTAVLTVPHPRMESRRFVLEPLAEIAPRLCLPGSGLSPASCLQRLTP